MPEYDVFLSHNNADKEAVEIIAHRLRDEAKLLPFLDEWHLIPGEPWQEAIEEALGQSETVAVFVGPSGISPWHNEEMRAGLDQAVRTRDDYRVIPVLLPEASEGALTGFLARRTWVDFRPGLDDAEAFERLVVGIKGEAIDVGDYGLPDEPAPYRGLLRFESEHAEFFFGRETDVQHLVERLGRQSFVAVIGASGGGKSSLVRAGLLPALAGDALPGSREWRTLVLTPGGAGRRSAHGHHYAVGRRSAAVVAGDRPIRGNLYPVSGWTGALSHPGRTTHLQSCRHCPTRGQAHPDAHHAAR